MLHLAAESHVDRSITGSRSFIETNIVGTHTMLEEARVYWSGLDGEAKDKFRFLHVSTDEVYGSLGPEGFLRSQPPMIPLRPMRLPRRRAITWRLPGIEPTGCR